MAEPESLPADPWAGIGSGYLRQRPWFFGRTALVVVVTLFLASYAGGVAYVVLWGEW